MNIHNSRTVLHRKPGGAEDDDDGGGGIWKAELARRTAAGDESSVRLDSLASCEWASMAARWV